MKFKGIEGGTPTGEPLCRTCSRAHRIQGVATSQVLISCSKIGLIPFEAYECNQYEDKRLPSINDMYQTAFILVSKRGQAIGFVSAKEYRDRYGLDDGAVPQPARISNWPARD